MKRDVFEKAAIEASSASNVIDTEIEQLDARKQLLLAQRESLQAVGRQLFSVMSMLAETTTEDEAAEVTETAEPAVDEHASEPVAFADAEPVATVEPVAVADAAPVAMSDAAPEATADSLAAEDAPTSAPEAAAEQSGEKMPSLSDLVGQSPKPFSLRNNGWPAATPVANRELRELARSAG